MRRTSIYSATTDPNRFLGFYTRNGDYAAGLFTWAYSWDDAIRFALQACETTGTKHYVYRNRSARYPRWEIEPREYRPPLMPHREWRYYQ